MAALPAIQKTQLRHVVWWSLVDVPTIYYSQAMALLAEHLILHGLSTHNYKGFMRSKALKGNFPRKLHRKSVHFLGNFLGKLPLRAFINTGIPKKNPARDKSGNGIWLLWADSCKWQDRKWNPITLRWLLQVTRNGIQLLWDDSIAASDKTGNGIWWRQEIESNYSGLIPSKWQDIIVKIRCMHCLPTHFFRLQEIECPSSHEITFPPHINMTLIGNVFSIMSHLRDLSNDSSDMTSPLPTLMNTDFCKLEIFKI